jgi:hypothetical protein
MKFFEHQEWARQNTQRLVGLYLLSIASIIFPTYVAIRTSWWLLLYLFSLSPVSISPPTFDWWEPKSFWLLATVIILLIGGRSWFKLMSLKKGGEAIAL